MNIHPLVDVPTSVGLDLKIYLIRGRRVMLDSDLADLYGVSTKSLNLATRRNKERFPEDFMFQLSIKETENLRFQFETSSLAKNYGGRRYLPYVFTQEGVAMLSGVLRSERAVQVNIIIMRAFVRLRELLSSHKELATKLEALEQKYDKKFSVVFEAIKLLMTEPVASDKSEIGFKP